MRHLLRHITPTARVVLFSLLLVLLPGIVLSYLGLRSVRERTEALGATHQATLSLLRDKIENEVAGCQKAVYTEAHQTLPLLRSGPDESRWLSAIASSHPVILIPFLLTSDGAVTSTDLSFDPPRTSTPPAPHSARFMQQLGVAENAEFTLHDLPLAVKLYEQASVSAGSASERATAIARGARCAFKSGQYRKGINSYASLLAKDLDRATIAGLPAPVVSLSEMADGYLSLHDSVHYHDAMLRLFRYLLVHPQDLADGEYLYYLRLASESTAALRPPGGVDSLAAREARLLMQAQAIMCLRPYAQSPAGSVFESPVAFISAVPGPDSMCGLPCICYALTRRTPGSAGTAFAFLPNRDFIVRELLGAALRGTDLGSGLIAAVIDSSNRMVAAQGAAPIHALLAAQDLSGLLKGWRVVLTDREGRSIGELGAAESRSYIFLIGLITLVMLTGVLLTARAAVHEAETARLKTEFVARVSHELKTPLSLIRMFSETLDSDIPVSVQQQKEFSGIIRKEAERLSRLVTGILDFSRMEAGKRQYRMQQVDAAALVRQALASFMYRLDEAGFSVETRYPEEPLTVYADPEALIETLCNILDNAVKFSLDEKFLAVTVLKENDRAVIRMEDHGIGIGRSDLPRVFEKFYRGTSPPVAAIRGTGLGLAIAREVIEKHGGTIEAQSGSGKGAVITVRLPVPPGGT